MKPATSRPHFMFHRYITLQKLTPTDTKIDPDRILGRSRINFHLNGSTFDLGSASGLHRQRLWEIETVIFPLYQFRVFLYKIKSGNQSSKTKKARRLRTGSIVIQRRTKVRAKAPKGHWASDRRSGIWDQHLLNPSSVTPFRFGRQERDVIANYYCW